MEGKGVEGGGAREKGGGGVRERRDGVRERVREGELGRKEEVLGRDT